MPDGSPGGSADSAISWPELIVLMGFGEDGGGLRGTFRVRDTHQLDNGPALRFDDDGGDDGNDEDDAEWADSDDEQTPYPYDYVEEHPQLGRLGVNEDEGVLLIRGQAYRIENGVGEPRMIQTPDDRWMATTNGMAHHDPSRVFISSLGGPDRLVDRPMPSRWEGTDFTRMAGPAVATEFLGRRAWAFELAPPSHKPYPLQMVVDAATGRVLSYRNDDFGMVTEWTSVEIGVELPDDLFRWDGPVTEEGLDDPDVDEAEKRDWLDRRGVRELTLPVPGELYLDDHDDTTGAFEATMHAHGFGGIARRPHSDEPWVRSRFGNRGRDHEYLWSDGGWDWRLLASAPLAEDELARVQEQLRDTR